MRSRFFQARSRRAVAGLALLVGVGAELLNASGAIAGGQAGLGCPPTFVAVTSQEWLDLPLNAAGVISGAHTVASLTNTFDAVNNNGDSLICAQDVTERSANGVPWTYFYNAVDDSSSAGNH